MEFFFYFLGAGLILLILEMVTPGVFMFFSLGVGAILASLCSFFVKEPAILVLLSAIFAFATFFIMKKFDVFGLKKQNQESNIDTYIGKKVHVLTCLEDGRYRVKIFGEEWFAVCKEQLNIGDEGEIESREGTTFYINKVSKLQKK